MQQLYSAMCASKAISCTISSRMFFAQLGQFLSWSISRSQQYTVFGRVNPLLVPEKRLVLRILLADLFSKRLHKEVKARANAIGKEFPFHVSGFSLDNKKNFRKLFPRLFWNQKKPKFLTLIFKFCINFQLNTIEIWLILPVVICLFQGLSHACLRITALQESAHGSLHQTQSAAKMLRKRKNGYLVRNAKLIHELRSSSRTTKQSGLPPSLGGWLCGWMKLQTNALHGAVSPSSAESIHLCESRPSRRILTNNCPISQWWPCSGLPWRWRERWIRVRFRRGSLRKGYHFYGGQQARK